MSVYEDIQAERTHQDEKWGGQQHDDQHDNFDWIVYITKHLGRAVQWPFEPVGYRQQMVRVAALAVAAVEWTDRQRQNWGFIKLYDPQSGVSTVLNGKAALDEGINKLNEAGFTGELSVEWLEQMTVAEFDALPATDWVQAFIGADAQRVNPRDYDSSMGFGHDGADDEIPF